MLAVGRALMSRPKLLMLDEPSLGLAPLVVRRSSASIASACARTGVSILLVEAERPRRAGSGRLRLRAGNRRDRSLRAPACKARRSPGKAGRRRRA
jgi:ABC-type sulfate/molybdate transport systems ATPase subunit